MDDYAKPFFFDRGVTTLGHDFVKPSDLHVGRVVDRYSFDAASVVFQPSSYSGVKLRVHFNGDRVLVKRPASVVLKVVYVNMLDDNHFDDSMIEFPKIFVEFEHANEGFPKSPLKVKATGGFTEKGSQFALMYKLLDSSKHFSFSGIVAGMTVYKQVHGFIEVTHLTMDSFDPGPISKIISGRKWPDASSVVREILNSEVNYLSALTTLISNYKAPMQASNAMSKALLTNDEIATLFSNADSILSAHVELLRELEEKIAEASKTFVGGDLPTAVGEAAAHVIIKVAPVLKNLYSVYAVNYPTAISLWEQRKNSSPLLVEFVQEANQASGRPRGLYEFLLMPMQRMNQLTILVQEIHKIVPKTHTSSLMLKTAVEAMHHVLQNVNDTIVRQEQANKMLEIQNKMSGLDSELILPSRTFIHEGFLMKISSSGLSVDRRWFFLFNDCIIYCKLVVQRRQFVFRGKWDLPVSYCRDLHDTPRLTNAFYMVTPKKTYVLVARTDKSKRVWMDSINHQVGVLLATSPGLRRKQAQFKEPKRSMLTFLFQRDYSSEQLYKGELEQLKAMNNYRKDSFHNELPEHMQGSDDSNDDDEDDNDSDTIETPINDKEQTERVASVKPTEPIPIPQSRTTVKSLVQRLPSLNKKSRKLSEAEISARINVFQSKRISAADFLLEALPTDLMSTSASVSDTSTQTDSHASPVASMSESPEKDTEAFPPPDFSNGYLPPLLPPLPPPPDNLDQLLQDFEMMPASSDQQPISAQPSSVFPANLPPPPPPLPGETRTASGLPAPLMPALSSLAGFRPRPLSIVVEEEDDELASSPKEPSALQNAPLRQRKPSLLVRAMQRPPPSINKIHAREGSVTSSYSFPSSGDSVIEDVPEDTFVNEPIPIQIEDLSVVSLPVLYTTTAGHLLKDLMHYLPPSMPTTPEAWVLFETQVGGTDRHINPSEFILATVLAWEVPEQMRFVARRLPNAATPPQSPARFRSPSITVRATRHYRDQQM